MSPLEQGVIYAIVTGLLMADVFYIARSIWPVATETRRARKTIEELVDVNPQHLDYSKAWSRLNQTRYTVMDGIAHQAWMAFLGTLVVGYALIFHSDMPWQLFAYAFAPWASVAFIVFIRYELDREYEAVSSLYLDGLLQHDRNYRHPERVSGDHWRNAHLHVSFSRPPD